VAEHTEDYPSLEPNPSMKKPYVAYYRMMGPEGACGLVHEPRVSYWRVRIQGHSAEFKVDEFNSVEEFWRHAQSMYNYLEASKLLRKMEQPQLRLSPWKRFLVWLNDLLE